MLKQLIRRLAAKAGYVIRKRPKLLAWRPATELRFDASYIFAHLFERCPSPYVVQVGAYDGVENDLIGNYIRRHRLAGMLIEPQVEPFAKLQKTYADQPQLTLCHTAVAEADGSRELYRIDPTAPGLPPWATQLATFRKDVLLAHEHAIPNIASYVVAEPVPCRTFDSLFREHCVSRVDLLQLDAEGYDFELLKMFPFERFKPLLVRYEHHHLSLSEQDDCLEMLAGKGFALFVPDALRRTIPIQWRIEWKRRGDLRRNLCLPAALPMLKSLGAWRADATGWAVRGHGHGRWHSDR